MFGLFRYLKPVLFMDFFGVCSWPRIVGDISVMLVKFFHNVRKSYFASFSSDVLGIESCVTYLLARQH